MRAAHYLCGLFDIKKGPDGHPMYQNNAFLAVLSDRHPNSMRAAAMHFNWDCWRCAPAGDSASCCQLLLSPMRMLGVWRSDVC